MFLLLQGLATPNTCMFICYMLIFLYAYDLTYDVFISISSSLVSWIRKSIPLKKNTSIFKVTLFFGLVFF